MPCQYQNIFGQPNQGLHSYRIFNYALIDLLLTLIISYLISWKYQFNLILTTLAIFILGQILHKVFCVQTQFIKLIFGH